MQVGVAGVVVERGGAASQRTRSNWAGTKTRLVSESEAQVMLCVSVESRRRRVERGCWQQGVSVSRKQEKEDECVW